MNESPSVFAKRIGIARKQNKGKGGGLNAALSWDAVLDLAVKAYWTKRGMRDAA